MKKIITFTGVDNKTSLTTLQILANRYSNIEFGILVSTSNTDADKANRFPSFETIDKVLNANLPSISCHICGELARHYVHTGDFSEIRDFLGQERVDKFSRFQLNIRGYDGFKPFYIEEDIKIIIQVSDAKSYNYFWDMNRLNPNKVSALIDYSGGHGKLGCFNYVSDGDEYMGYAGGISISNVAYILGYIEGRMEYDVDYWLDMESSVRTDDWFDTSKVREICSEVERFKDIRENMQ